VGRVTGHRGGGGEITVKEFGGDAGLWTPVERVWVVDATGGEEKMYRVAGSRAYSDRLVLKLEGIDGPGEAAQLKGREIRVAPEDAPELPEETHYRAWMTGLGVYDETGRVLGKVVGMLPTGGVDLLQVARAGEAGGESGELLIPWVKEIVLTVAEDEGRMTVRLPEGLEELNAPGG